MLSVSSWLHLRFPFSYFLLPVFLFALAISPNITVEPLLWSFMIIHIFLYPASNGYNSYFDKDEKSIGVLKNPPPVNEGLYYLSVVFDVIAIVLGYITINPTFAVMLLIYGLVSKAYSHPSIRLKKYAITSWIVTGIFQGLFTFIMCYIGINRFEMENALKLHVVIPGILASVMLMANYPMTQIYQHEEDMRRGDYTLSARLGIYGTFHFTAVVFMLALAGFIAYFNTYFSTFYTIRFIVAISPVLLFFIYWYFKVRSNVAYADYKHTMWLNLISATGLNVFFIFLFLHSTQILQAFQ